MPFLPPLTCTMCTTTCCIRLLRSLMAGPHVLHIPLRRYVLGPLVSFATTKLDMGYVPVSIKPDDVAEREPLSVVSSSSSGRDIGFRSSRTRSIHLRGHSVLHSGDIGGLRERERLSSHRNHPINCLSAETTNFCVIFVTVLVIRFPIGYRAASLILPLNTLLSLFGRQKEMQ